MPLIVDPALQAAVIRQFNLRGELAPFNLTENVVPTFDIGVLAGQTVDPTVVTTLAGVQGVRVGTPAQTTALTVNAPRYDDGNVVNSGVVNNPGAGQVIVDTGQLNVGTHLIHWLLNIDVLGDLHVEWRNAADAATLVTWPYGFGAGVQHEGMFQTLNLNLAQNERIRIITPAAVVGNVNATIGTAAVQTSAAS